MAAERQRFDARRMPGFIPTALTVFVMLYAPIALLGVYSFNAGESIVIFEGFSWRWYRALWANETLIAATLRSVQIALVAATCSTLLATMAALAITRGPAFRGRTAAYAVINLPLMAPEIVTAVALLIFFALIKIATGYQGLGYLLLAHTAFCIPFAFLPIRGRLEGMDGTLEMAAADLYATPWQAFRHVTLPLLWPGVLAGFMLAFVISLDDVVITLLVAGPGQETLPVFVLGQLRRIITPEINAVSTALLAASIIVVSLVFVINRGKTP